MTNKEALAMALDILCGNQISIPANQVDQYTDMRNTLIALHNGIDLAVETAEEPDDVQFDDPSAVPEFLKDAAGG